MKDTIMGMIQSKLDEKVKFYNDKMSALEVSENVPDIFYLITETFGNSMEQKEALVLLMNDKFTSEFFKRAEVKKRTNEIEVTDGKYAVYFPTSFIRTIKVKRIDEVKVSMMKPNISMRMYTRDFAITYSDYKDNPSKENGENLRKVFLEDVMHKKPKIFGKGPKLEDLIEKIHKFYNTSVSEAYDYNERLTKWKENKDKLESSEIDDFEFLEDVKQDLELFANSESWKISAEGLNAKSIKFSFLFKKDKTY